MSQYRHRAPASEESARTASGGISPSPFQPAAATRLSLDPNVGCSIGIHPGGSELALPDLTHRSPVLRVMFGGNAVDKGDPRVPHRRAAIRATGSRILSVWFAKRTIFSLRRTCSVRQT